MSLTAFAAATVIWQTDVLPRWLATVAELSGILHIIGASSLPPATPKGRSSSSRFAGLIAFAVFVAASSVCLVSGRSTLRRAT
jgi:hypothetical protein